MRGLLTTRMLRRRTDTNLRPDPPRDRPRSWSAKLPTVERQLLRQRGESAEPSRVQSRAQSRSSQSRSQSLASLRSHSLASLRSLTSTEPSRVQTPFESALGDDFDERVLNEVFGRSSSPHSRRGSPSSRKGSPGQRRGGSNGSPGLTRSKSSFDAVARVSTLPLPLTLTLTLTLTLIQTLTRRLNPNPNADPNPSQAPAAEAVGQLQRSASGAVMRPRKPGQRAG